MLFLSVTFPIFIKLHMQFSLYQNGADSTRQVPIIHEKTWVNGFIYYIILHIVFFLKY